MSMAARMLRHARRRAGLTQRQLAAKTGVAQETIARIESGTIDPRVSTLDRLLEGCGFGLEHLPRLGIGIDRTQIAHHLDVPPDLLADPDPGLDYGALAAPAVERRVAGVDVLVASLDDIIAMKRAAGRPKDRIELEILGALREEIDRRGTREREPKSGTAPEGSDTRRSPGPRTSGSRSRGGASTDGEGGRSRAGNEG